MRVLGEAGRFTVPTSRPVQWVENLRISTLSVGTYSIPAGARDDQRPHTEDEIYVVQSGRARLETDAGLTEVGPGSVVFVPALEAHRFVDVVEDLCVLVLFAPPEHSRRMI